MKPSNWFAPLRGIPLAPLDLSGEPAASGLRELYGADLALIRPDQHLAWRGDEVKQFWVGFFPLKDYKSKN